MIGKIIVVMLKLIGIVAVMNTIKVLYGYSPSETIFIIKMILITSTILSMIKIVVEHMTGKQLLSIFDNN